MNSDATFSPLFTDLYELTMMAAYQENHMTANATFSLFIRGYEQLNRGYFIAAGLQDALRSLEQLRFSQGEIEYLQRLNLFPRSFIQALPDFRFTGDVWAMPEGTICFSDEPLMEVTAPIAEAQLVETFLINIIGFQTNIATKAARCIHAAKGRPIVDFSLRRTQGLDAGMQVARSTYIAGFSGTSNVLAARRYDIPVSGTMAHSFVLAFRNDGDAFQAYARTFPDDSVFLIDTRHVLHGAHDAVNIAKIMAENGHRLKGVRIDSGDMVESSRQVRHILDEAGLQQVQIIATSGFDEYKIEKTLISGAIIDAFGVGANIGVSSDSPFLDVVYKMVRYHDRDVRKTSPGKTTLAGEKQVFRRINADGRPTEDIIACRNEVIEGAEPLLEKVMTDGKRQHPLPSLAQIRAKIQSSLSAIDQRYTSLQQPARYPVHLSRNLSALQL